MLKEKNNVLELVPGDKVAIHFLNGAEVLGELVTRTETEWLLRKPILIGKNQEGIGTGPINLCSMEAEVVSFSNNHVFNYTKMSDTIANAYEETVSEIVMPKKSGIITSP